MTMTLRNEERFLASNLAWHYFMGVRRAYIYLDRCTDRSEAIARSFPWVEVHKRDRPASCQFLAQHLQGCAREALLNARRDGAKWLLFLDADEFACAEGIHEGHEPDGLAALTRRMAPETDMVVLRPREAIPVRSNSHDPFEDHVFFQDGALLERDLLDPSTGTIRRLDKLIGHKEGKSIVRVDADVEPRLAHRWRAVGGGPLRREFTGFHYHFLLTSGAHFLEKYGKMAHDPDCFHNGQPVPFPKQAFKDAARTMAAGELERFYDEWVAMDCGELERLVERGSVIKDIRLKMALGHLTLTT